MTDTPVTEWSESADVGQFTITRKYPDGGDMTAVQFVLNLHQLLERAKTLVEKLDRAETHEGGLLTVDMLRAKNELRLELARWK